VKWRADAERAEARANLAESAASNLSQQRAELIADLDFR
jgi:hypothetical protein